MVLLLTACPNVQPPPGNPPPAVPTGLAVQAGNGQVILNWNANGESDLAKYNVYQGTVSGSLGKVGEVTTGSESFTTGGLANGTTYFFAIDAEDSEGNRSSRTAEVSATPSATAPVTCTFDDPASTFDSCTFGP